MQYPSHKTCIPQLICHKNYDMIIVAIYMYVLIHTCMTGSRFITVSLLEFCWLEAETMLNTYIHTYALSILRNISNNVNTCIIMHIHTYIMYSLCSCQLTYISKHCAYKRIITFDTYIHSHVFAKLWLWLCMYLMEYDPSYIAFVTRPAKIEHIYIQNLAYS